MNHGVVEISADDLAVVAEEELDALREAVDFGFQRAKFIAELFVQHRDDAVDKIRGIAAAFCFLIEGCAGAYVMGDIGDVDPEFPAVCSGTLKTDSVIKVAGIVGIDRDYELLSAIATAMRDFSCLVSTMHHVF